MRIRKISIIYQLFSLLLQRNKIFVYPHTLIIVFLLVFTLLKLFIPIIAALYQPAMRVSASGPNNLCLNIEIVFFACPKPWRLLLSRTHRLDNQINVY